MEQIRSLTSMQNAMQEPNVDFKAKGYSIVRVLISLVAQETVNAGT